MGDVILVIDIGGGTTDFTLIEVQEQAGEIALERVAVGEHILIGGDNVDAALAHTRGPISFRRNWTRCSFTLCGSTVGPRRRSC